MKFILIFIAFLFASTLVQAKEVSHLEVIENNYVQDIVNCPFSSQSKANRSHDQRIVASLTAGEKTKKKVVQKTKK